jgi:stage V sporulation protein S
MNRFFSKLDLRDIKIDPVGNRFPPEGEEVAEDVTVAVAGAVAIEVRTETVIAAIADEPVVAAADEDGGEPVRADGTLKVSARSRPSAVAGAIAGVVRERGRAEVQAIGAGATNQAVKAVAIAREYLRETGIDAVCLPTFIDVAIDGEDRTAMLLIVEVR